MVLIVAPPATYAQSVKADCVVIVDSVSPDPVQQADARNDSYHSEQKEDQEQSPSYDYPIENYPAAQEQLVADIKAIYANLVKIEATCIECSKHLAPEIKSFSKETHEQWGHIDSLQEQISKQNKKSSSAFTSRSPRRHSTKLRRLVQEYSLQSRNWQRLNDRLLPLLRREQDFDSSVQWLEVMKLSTSLCDLLNKSALVLDNVDQEAAEALEEVLDLMEALLKRLTTRFRRKYTSLKHIRSLAELLFVFPDNMRHICTTMPWTMSPTLMVLWGVCWMFIIQSRRVEQELLTAASPIVSPTSIDVDPHNNRVSSNAHSMCSGRCDF